MNPRRTDPPKARSLRRGSPSRHPAPRRLPAGPAPKVRPEHRVGPLHAEVIAVGREILRGRTADTTTRYLAQFLSLRGAVVHRITIVDDNDRAISEAVTEAFVRGARLVVTTGGLGPTDDDRTLGAVADALRLPLAIHAEAREMVESAYRRLQERRVLSGTGLTAAREKMCALPLGSEPVPNTVGTAPGVITRLPGGAAVLCLPGVPDETRSVFDAAVPLLKELAPKGAVARRDVETPTADESALKPLLDRICEEFPFVWVKSYAPGFRKKESRILVTLEASAATQKEADSMVEGALRLLLSASGGR